MTDSTVVRGGSGLYYGDALGADQSFATGNAQIVVIQYTNDGRPDFAANPTNGQPLPTYAQAQPQLCSANPAAFDAWTRSELHRHRAVSHRAPSRNSSGRRSTSTCRARSRPRSASSTRSARRPRSRPTTCTARATHEKDVVDNINLTFNPATGANFPFSDRATRPYPDWGVVSMNTHLGRSAYHALQTVVHQAVQQSLAGRRRPTRCRGSGTRTRTPFSGLEPVPFATAPDLGGEWGLSADDQRHRAVFNGIWQVGHGFQVSALHFFAAGHPAGRTPTAAIVRGTGATLSAQRLRPDGTIVPRNDLIAPAQNRTDLRLQQRIPLGSRRSIDGIAEVFNVFNRPNWGIGTQESTTTQFLQHTIGAGADGAVRLPSDVLAERSSRPRVLQRALRPASQLPIQSRRNPRTLGIWSGLGFGIFPV